MHKRLDTLLAAYESKGDKIRQKCQWFSAELLPEIICLYSWRAGQTENTWDSKFRFRDNSFCCIDRAEREYMSMMNSYGTYPEDHLMLKYSFPFAVFEGAWHVMPTKGHCFNQNLNAPVVSV